MDNKNEVQVASDIDNVEVLHEKRDIDVRIVVGFGVALAIAAIVIHLFIWLLFDVFGHLETSTYPRTTAAGPPLTEIRLPPIPRLQDRPREDLKALRAHEDELLDGYTWIDQSTGAVRIPIGEAMKQVVQQGFPVAEQPAEKK